MACLGIDFGTSNTAAGYMDNGAPKLIALEPGSATMPTAVFADFEDRNVLFGSEAVRSMIDGVDGRFMRALKSILGTSLAREKRQFLNTRLTLIDIIAMFLTELRKRAEAQTGQRFTRALSGRPVRFHSASDARDAQALLDLTDAYKLAGFEEVTFLPEPEAAALAASQTGLVLIVDIGGGTSDFTLCNSAGGQADVLASRGLRLGGTDFDKTLSLAHAMPLLGYGAQIKAELGNQTMAAPKSLFHDLASWEKISFVYDAALYREVLKWARLSDDPARFTRLAHVLDMHLGHDVAFAVEDAKIAANGSDLAAIDLGVVERGLKAALSQTALTAALQDGAAAIAQHAEETVGAAGWAPEDVEWVVLVGGSSLLTGVQTGLRAVFPTAQHVESEVFTAVVDGLALASGQR